MRAIAYRRWMSGKARGYRPTIADLVAMSIEL
jgi:hypothetical protein